MGNEFARLIEVVAWQLLNRSNSSLTGVTDISSQTLICIRLV
jgi:hypothetical protein